MAFFLAVVLGFAAWPFVSYNYPTLLSKAPIYPLNVHKDNAITPRLSTFIEKTLARENIMGLSAAVVLKDREPAFHTWGNRTENGDKVTPNTLFHVASLSKSFCATALGMLVDDFANGKNVTALPSGLTELTWHTRLRDLLPDWQLMDICASESVNLQDILSHMSGLPRHDFALGPSDTPRELISRLKYFRPAFELRERWSYCNIMYMVASHVIATYAGQSYTSFVEDRIFTPLGMTASTFSPTTAVASGNFSQGWTKHGRRLPERITEDTAFPMAGPAGIISNTIDMVKWISTWIGEGVHNNQIVIPRSVYRNVSDARVIAVGHPDYSEYSIVGYGMGWYRSSYRGHEIVFHSGTVPGFSAMASFFPATEMGIILFANGEQQEAVLALILNRILDSVLHLNSPYPKRLTPFGPPSPPVPTTEVRKNRTLPLDAFAGTYTNPGYGSFTLCSVFSVSPSCTAVQSDFHAINSIRGTPVSEDLLAKWPRLFSSHVRLRRQHDLVFDIYFTSLYPNGCGKDATPFETGEPGAVAPQGSAEFVVKEGKVVGFGIGGWVGQIVERAGMHGTVRDRAEVWFDKV